MYVWEVEGSWNWLLIMSNGELYCLAVSKVLILHCDYAISDADLFVFVSNETSGPPSFCHSAIYNSHI